MATEITRSRIDWLSDLITAADDVWMAGQALGLDIEIDAGTDYYNDGRSRVRIIIKEAKRDDKT